MNQTKCLRQSEAMLEILLEWDYIILMLGEKVEHFFSYSIPNIVSLKRFKAENGITTQVTDRFTIFCRRKYHQNGRK